MKMYLIGTCVGIIVGWCGAEAKPATPKYRINPSAKELVTEDVAIKALLSGQNQVEKCTPVQIKNVTKLASKKQAR